MPQILIVDDDKPLAKMLKQFFQRYGHTCFNAVNSKEAFEILGKEKIDLIFLDIKLGEENGIVVCGEIRKEYPEIQIVAVSGFLTKADIRECEKAGFDSILSKPLSINELRNLMSSWF